MCGGRAFKPGGIALTEQLIAIRLEVFKSSTKSGCALCVGLSLPWRQSGAAFVVNRSANCCGVSPWWVDINCRESERVRQNIASEAFERQIIGVWLNHGWVNLPEYNQGQWNAVQSFSVQAICYMYTFMLLKYVIRMYTGGGGRSVRPTEFPDNNISINVCKSDTTNGNVRN